MSKDSSDDHKYIKLISAEGHEFIVSKKCVLVSKTLNLMLSRDTQFIENITGEVHLREISTPVLEKVIQYFYFRERYKDFKELPKFEIGEDIVLPVLMASWFLET